MRRRTRGSAVVVALFMFCVYCVCTLSMRTRAEQAALAGAGDPSGPDAAAAPPPPPLPSRTTWDDPPAVHGNGANTPKKATSTGIHPIEELVGDAQREFDATKSRQSTTLRQAVDEYRRRYKMPPPPHFDKWFEFARKNNVQLIDEFDTIYELMTPFWGLKPKTTRERAKEALGGDNFLLGVAIRDGKVAFMEGQGDDWQREATQGMLDKFVEYLPDMDLAFNVHDEPRVVVPHDDMTRLVGKARGVNMPAANAVAKPVNEFSPTPAEIAKGSMTFDETKVTRFNVFAHQPTWTHSRMSCPPDSPARVLEEDDRVDAMSDYGYGDLGFVYNATALSDICLSPSLSTTYGFFDRPNSYDIVHDLFPIFSQSKISSYADIIYPSPWYWYGKVSYDESQDIAWADKRDQLYWRGSTTGGFSRNGGWRRQHRQHFVQKINSPDETTIMTDVPQDDGTAAATSASQHNWRTKTVSRGDYRDLIDVKFSHVGQCDPGDCDAQINFFGLAEQAMQHAAWAYKYLVDLDGNAFSGRFYAFLQSRSLVFKMALFREWHYEWLRPWIHYVPLTLRGDEWLEAIRYFARDKETGQALGRNIANDGRTWANKVLRNEDLEAWFFRLLLEYARVIDDNREIIGFDPSSADKRLPLQPRETPGPVLA
ncbi:CAP10 [Geosmithia morbida]|uniref:CAP10 n=1 Tax=Geosmithia morbida TaxID=1094350 RepID=A0A9P4YUI8_9HYPO|nr:CAP10 [Geosmithia morbida]KAF4121274.1 CAP10 [Geosmithia morbida]